MAISNGRISDLRQKAIFFARWKAEVSAEERLTVQTELVRLAQQLQDV